MNTKNLFRILCSTLVAGALLFTACKKESKAFKESANPDENYRNIMTQAKEINEYTLADMQTYTEETQRLIFQEMTPENKARIFKERIDYAINLETNTIKINMLNAAKGMLTPSIYSQALDSVSVANIEQYVESMIPVFGYDNTKNIVTTLGVTGSNLMAGGSPGGGNSPAPNPKCNCNQKEDYCFGPALVKCRAIICDGKVDGCGIWWKAPCNGKCGLP